MNKDTRYQLYKNTVHPGWWPILDRFIPKLLAIAPDAELLIKQKFGVLRLNARSKTIDRQEFIEIEKVAACASSTVCEFCGAPGKLRPKRDWMQTLCNRCNAAKTGRVSYILEKSEKKWLATALAQQED